MQDQLKPTESRVSAEEVSQALQRVLQSPEWSQSARMAEFLRFVVEQTRQGAGDQLKQTVIGVSVFGRDSDYDPRVDPVVRVEARRLRAKLQEYYSGSGAADPIRIDLPKGTYQPSFSRLAPTPVAGVPPPKSSFLRPVLLATLALAVTAFLLSTVLFRNPPAVTTTPRLLTDRQAYVRSPRFSPDGNRIVFSREPGFATSHIVVTGLTGGEPSPLTSGDVRDYEPEWSPDGRRIAFLREQGEQSFTILLRDASPGATAEEALVSSVRQRSPVAFSRDGRTLFFADRPAESAPAAIYSLSLASRQRKPVTTPPAGIAGDAHPQISPDGSKLAFLRRTEAGVQDIWLQDIDGTRARRLSHENASFQGICWAADGKSVLASLARQEETGSLWRFPVDGREPSRVAEAGIGPLTPSVSAAGNRLAFIMRIADTNIWRASLSDRGAGTARALTSSAALDSSPQISPDGSRLVWRSSSTGTNEIWIASAMDGSDARRLTSMRGPLTGSPRWSPDGAQIVFESRRDGRGRLFLIPATGGTPREFTQGPSNDILPSWSRDGSSVYFASDRSGQWQVWRARSDGQNPEQITKNGGFAAFESWDGRMLYYSRPSGGIWKVPRDGGAEVLVTDELTANLWGQFALSEKSLFYAVFTPQRRVIRRLDLASGARQDALALTRLPVQWDSGMAVTRDGSAVAWSQLDVGASDLYVIDGFR